MAVLGDDVVNTFECLGNTYYVFGCLCGLGECLLGFGVPGLQQHSEGMGLSRLFEGIQSLSERILAVIDPG